MITIEDIWKERIKHAPKKNWNGSDPKPMFDYDKITNSEPYKVVFNKHNFNDLVNHDFREVLDTIAETHVNKGIPNVIEHHNTFITYVCTHDYSEHTYMITSKSDKYLPIMVNIYKSRGGIESLCHPSDHDINISTFTDCLIDLGLVDGTDYINDEDF